MKCIARLKLIALLNWFETLSNVLARKTSWGWAVPSSSQAGVKLARLKPEIEIETLEMVFKKVFKMMFEIVQMVQIVQMV